MKFAGFIKNSFVDYPNNISAVVFTFGCNFNCWYCHNRKIIEDKAFENISEEEVLSFLKGRRGLIDGVVISGGEPTLNPTLEDFIKKIKNMGFKIKLDTNGSNPFMLKKLLDENLLDFIAMDIKTSPQKYEEITDSKIEFKNLLESINLIMSSNIEYEFRTTFAPDVSISDIEEISELISGAKAYAIQKFNMPDKVNKKFIPIPHSRDDYFAALEVAKKNVQNSFLRSLD